jgi:DNA (cytosine-5)-methyltransferase 1
MQDQASRACTGTERLGDFAGTTWHDAGVDAGARYSIAGLFAGIGGLEAGLHRAGHTTELLCEVWEPARAVLAVRFPGTTVEPDIRSLESLPDVDVVTAGFPCTDLSQAGRTAGIGGAQSGLVSHVFRLVDACPPRYLVLENVRNMLALDRGRAMTYLVEELEGRGYRWAYRLVDSRFTGVPQRRQRVLVVASRTDDPRAVLLADDAGEPAPGRYRADAYGFYWTEGLRGLGWAVDATPTLKGGSAIGIPSPPAVWLPGEVVGRRLVTPSVEDAEALQGFPRGWTAPAANAGRGGVRWKLVGNAVTVGVAAWLGCRLAVPGRYDESEATRLAPGEPWPGAAWGAGGERWRSNVSMWPRRGRYRHLRQVLDPQQVTPLSHRAAAGFLRRAQRANLRFDEDFLLDVKRHVEATAGR